MNHPAAATPLFPLQSVLFPEGYLQLQIFEPRYLDMVQRCWREDRPFGVLSLIEGSEVRRRDPTRGEAFVQERFQSVGTLARIEHCDTPQAGLMRIRCRGGQRFRLLTRECLPGGLWVGQIEPLAEDASVPVPTDLKVTSTLLQSLLHSLEQGAAAVDVPLQPPYRWDDSGWLANRWCELLPLPPEERQRLMQLDNPLLRLELVADQLDQPGVLAGRA